MAVVTFSVRGSAPEPYRVTFTRGDGGNLTATCNCQAGVTGQYCKHRLAILSGDAAGVNSANEADVTIVASWLAGSDVDKTLQLLVAAEQELELAKRRVSVAKKAVARAMSD